jgi:hypothetical protein
MTEWADPVGDIMRFKAAAEKYYRSPERLEHEKQLAEWREAWFKQLEARYGASWSSITEPDNS